MSVRCGRIRIRIVVVFAEFPERRIVLKEVLSHHRDLHAVVDGIGLRSMSGSLLVL